MELVVGFSRDLELAVERIELGHEVVELLLLGGEVSAELHGPRVFGNRDLGVRRRRPCMRGSVGVETLGAVWVTVGSAVVGAP